MRKFSFRRTVIYINVLLLPLAIGVLEGQTQTPSPVAAAVVREGTFAIELAGALSLGQPESEAEAENMLGSVGISPRNGWIADYPVTPDIIGELRDAVIYAAQANTINMDVDTALRTLEGVKANLDVAVSPGPAGPPESSAESEIEGCPNQAAVNNYYEGEEGGPPIVTYCAPPPDYYGLYSWVPYPFWWSGVWFGGFFVLHDFHRHFREHNHVYVVSNHFHDANEHKVYRIDPLKRFNGKTFAGIGAPRSKNFISPGVQRAPERIFNNNRPAAPPPGRTGRPQGDASGTVRPPSARSNYKPNPFPENRVYSQPPGEGRTFTPRSPTPPEDRTFTPQPSMPGDGRSVTPGPASPDGGRTSTAPGGGEGGARRR